MKEQKNAPPPRGESYDRERRDTDTPDTGFRVDPSVLAQRSALQPMSGSEASECAPKRTLRRTQMVSFWQRRAPPE